MSKELSDLLRDEVIDSRDIEERIDDLESDRDAYQEDVNEAQEAIDDADEDADDLHTLEANLSAAQEALKAWEEDNAEELMMLTAFRDEVEGYTDWRHGETLIQEEYWTEYVRDMLADTGEIPRDLPSYIVIDWDATADNIKADYSEAELDGQTYYFRCS